MKSILLFSLTILFCITLYAQAETADQRISFFTLQIKIHPDSVNNYIGRSKAYIDKANYISAINDCNTALQKEPQNIDALKLRAYAFYQSNKLDSSIIDLDKVLKIKPTDAYAWNLQGLNYYWQSKYEKAIENYSEALQLNPKYADAWYNRGEANYWAGKYDNAIGDISQSIIYDANNIKNFYTRGMSYFKLGKYEMAAADYTAGLNINPNDVDLLISRASNYYLTGKYDSARIDFTTVLKIDPNNIVAWIYRGNIYRDLENYANSISDYSQALLIDPKNAEALYQRGYVNYISDKPEDAIADFTDVLKIIPQHHNALIYRGSSFLDIEKYDLALNDFNAELNINPKNILAIIMRGKCYRKMRNYDLALKDYNEALRLDPKSFSALTLRGDLYSLLKKNDEAIKDYNDALNINPKAFEPRINRGNIFHATAKYDLAISDYTMVLEQDPKFTTALINRGFSNKFLGNYDLAIADLSLAISLNPSSADALSKRGAVYMDKFQYDSAIIDFTKALRINPGDTISLNERGLVYKNQKRYDKAIADFNEAIKIKPDFSNAFNNRGLVYYRTGKYDMAIADYKTALSFKPEKEALITLNLILVYLAADKIEDAALLYNQYRQKKLSSYMEAAKPYSFLKNYIAACCDFLLKKDYAGAIALLNTSLEEYKDVNQDNVQIPVSGEYANVLARAAFVYEKLNQPENALDCYKKAIIINPQLSHLSAKIAAVDALIKSTASNNPPVIDLITPIVLQGSIVQAQNNISQTLYIKGVAKDITGIKWVKVNDRDVTLLLPDGYFSAELKGDVKDFTIKTSNNKGLITSASYKIQNEKLASEENEIKPIQPDAKPAFHAVLIACSNYSGNKWKTLPTTISEATAYKNLLIKYYGFENENILEIYDKERMQILDKLDSKLKSLKENDNLVILFAGHGDVDTSGNTPIGYWIPINANKEIEYISNEDLSGITRRCAAKHILVLSDACYSAAMRSKNENTNDNALDENMQWKLKSRQILTSGGFEKVPSKSIFINMVLTVLELTDKKTISAKALLNMISNGVVAQTKNEPELNPFGEGHKGGQFYFIKAK